MHERASIGPCIKGDLNSYLILYSMMDWGRYLLMWQWNCVIIISWESINTEGVKILQLWPNESINQIWKHSNFEVGTNDYWYFPIEIKNNAEEVSFEIRNNAMRQRIIINSSNQEHPEGKRKLWFITDMENILKLLFLHDSWWNPGKSNFQIYCWLWNCIDRFLM